MPNGIIVFGANGCGKTTLGFELARRLNMKHLGQYRTEKQCVKVMADMVESTHG
jgi:shikimate kinase